MVRSAAVRAAAIVAAEADVEASRARLRQAGFRFNPTLNVDVEDLAALVAELTGRAKSNLSRTLKKMASYGLVTLERGERGRVAPRVVHDRVALDLPLVAPKRAAGGRR